MSESAVPPRLIDASQIDEFFWKSGADGKLRFLACTDCGRMHHPPSPRCPYCYGPSLQPSPVSGRATVVTFTVNHQEFLPDWETPYVIAIVEIEEDPTIRLTTNIVGLQTDEVTIGQRLEVSFEANGEWFVPLFGPPSA